MAPLIWIVLVVVAVLFLFKVQDLLALMRPSTPQSSESTINSGEYSLIKPAGFYVDNGPSLLGIYSVNKTGAATFKDGQSIREEFNCGWAVVSVTPGDCLDMCREVAQQNADEVVSESESESGGESGGDRTLLITTKTKTPAYFVIETTHKVIFSRDRNKTYELRASVLTSKKDDYGPAINRVIKSFRLTP